MIDWTTHSDRTQCSDHKIADGKLQSLSYEAPGHHYTKPEPERYQIVERTLALSWSENSHSLTHHTLTQWAAVVGFKSYVCFFSVSILICLRKCPLNAIEDRRRLFHPWFPTSFPSSKPQCCSRHTAWSMFWLSRWLEPRCSSTVRLHHWPADRLGSERSAGPG